MHSLALRYGKVGRREEALQLTEYVVQRRIDKLGEQHPNTIGSIDALAYHWREARQ